jgi:arginyl-tRNA synthetase
MIRQEIRDLISKSAKELQQKGILPDFDLARIKIERPEVKEKGDFSTSLAMILAKETRRQPLEIAEFLKSKISGKGFFEKVEAVGPGFLNFFLSSEALQKQIKEILEKKDKYGELETGSNKKVNVEFISANPTGPLTLGNGRGGFCGDVLTNVLNKAGYKAKKEYYVNDTGEQVRKLGHSVLGDEQAVYKGKYIEDLRKRVKGDKADEVGEKAAQIILEEMIRPSVRKMGIDFDFWFSEKSLYKRNKISKVLDFLKKKGLSYEKDNALWFKSTDFKDDKDRVLIKAGGETTYIASDAAYLKDKAERGFERFIYIWGADHFGYVERVKAMAKALEVKSEPEIIIMQLVRLFEGGQEVRMSKRTGVYVVLDELIDEVGVDVARYFFLTRSPGTHLNFDLGLAKQQTEKNPVFYIQYAHARICSILRKSNGLKPSTDNLDLLKEKSEQDLIKKLIQLPEIVEDVSNDFQVQRLPQYALELASTFHRFYQECKVVSDDKKLSQARLALVLATKIVLKNTLSLMGISAPEKM